MELRQYASSLLPVPLLCFKLTRRAIPMATRRTWLSRLNRNNTMIHSNVKSTSIHLLFISNIDVRSRIYGNVLLTLGKPKQTRHMNNLVPHVGISIIKAKTARIKVTANVINVSAEIFTWEKLQKTNYYQKLPYQQRKHYL